MSYSRLPEIIDTLAARTGFDAADIRTIADLVGQFERSSDFLRLVAAGFEASTKNALAEGVSDTCASVLKDQIRTLNVSDLHDTMATLDDAYYEAFDVE